MTEDRPPQSSIERDPNTGLPRSTYDPATDPDGPELMRRIERAVARLRPRQRNMFLLSRVNGTSYGEIANMYGISEEQARRIIFEALVAVRHEMDHGKPLPWRERFRRWKAGLRRPPV